MKYALQYISNIENMNRVLALLTLLSFHYIPTSSTPVHLFTFHKTDRMNTLDWYNYHIDIFGANNIHGFDHNSSGLANILHLLRQRGLDITVVPSSVPFGEKHVQLTKAMLKYRLRKERSFLVPLDIDEYIVAVVPTADGASFSTDRELILKLFNALPQDGYKYAFSEFMGSFCNKSVHDNHSSFGRLVTHFSPFNPLYDICLYKKFYLNSGFISTDQGNHVGVVQNDRKCLAYTNANRTSKLGNVYQPPCLRYNSSRVPAKVPMCFHKDTKLGIVHFGSSSSLSFEQYRAKAMRAAIQYNMNITNMKGPEGCVGRGMHYCQFLVRSLQMGTAAMEARMEKERSCNITFFNAQIKNKLIGLDAKNMSGISAYYTK